MATTPINSVHRTGASHAAEEARRKLLEQDQADGLQNLQAAPSIKPQINLFDKTTYDSNVEKTGGTQPQAGSGLPTFSDDEQTQIHSLIDSVPDEHKAAVNQAGLNLAQSVWASLGVNTVPQTTPPTATAQSVGAATTAVAASPFRASKQVAAATEGASTQPASAFASKGTVVGSTTTGPATVSQASPDVQNAFNQTAIAYSSAVPTDSYDSAVTRTALVGVMGLQGSLKDFSNDMAGTVKNENTLRADASELQNVLTNWPDGAATQDASYHTVSSDGTITAVASAPMTKQQVSDALDNVKNAGSTMSDATQMQMLQLQSMEQNYQQGVTTISNVMRTSYDMVKNTLQNIHY